MRARDCNGRHCVLPPGPRISPTHFSGSLISTCPSCMGNLLRMRLVVSSPKSFRGLGISRFWIGSESRHHSIVVSLPILPRIKSCLHLHHDLSQRNLERFCMRSSPRRHLQRYERCIARSLNCPFHDFSIAALHCHASFTALRCCGERLILRPGITRTK